MKGFVVIFLFINLCGVIQVAGRNEKTYLTPFASPLIMKLKVCTVPECDGMIKYEKKIPSKEELWDKYCMGAPKQHRRFVEQYKIEKRA
ncbi:hypothetical protein HUB92_04105 [Wolbachia endosymbiont of Wiebesia pumilae]|uniref:hypothetical protein n=1 Tax=Wolbachia endosymbiont of Wiebesia pumilae TaxID=2742717 RepID=UPI001AE8596F|nr:hypothetical protein [Wolbachia endosymbiont of Wiebesia pumilae]QTP62062.1 hypothetical protein HUB92_04105 [Wolbachia endosymbiont of Wiebesia pumilae]